MLKFKKILNSFICLVILLSFAASVSLEFASVAAPKPRKEVSAADQHNSVTVSLIAEERDDSHDHYNAVVIPVHLFLSAFIFFNFIPVKLSLLFNSEKLTPKGSLYINFRSLRL